MHTHSPFSINNSFSFVFCEAQQCTHIASHPARLRMADGGAKPMPAFIYHVLGDAE